ncbi:hypothetical protein ACH5RR_032652 [Cinchona calisaya]|uniref:Uncharacterized protein n=1 Tax=Cinchona calisaya TaxID=153742 RepID=A0ABD2YM83_9GENT
MRLDLESLERSLYPPSERLFSNFGGRKLEERSIIRFRYEASQNSALATKRNEPESDTKRSLGKTTVRSIGIHEIPARNFLENCRIGRRKLLLTTRLSKQLVRSKGNRTL